MSGTDKDRNNLWSEMPPTSKNRSEAKHYQPVNVPPQPEEDNKKKHGKKADNSKKQSKSVKNPESAEKQAKPSKKTNKNSTQKKDARSAVRRMPAEQKPEYLDDSDNRSFNVAKPIDIQSRAIKNKKRTHDNKNKRRKASPMRYIYYFVLFGILGFILLAVLSTTVLFNTANFAVEGETVYSEQEVITACGVDIGQNLITLDKGAVEQTLIEKLPYIDKAEVYVQLPDTLHITLNQSKAVANIKQGSKYYLISENGRIMDAELTKPDKNYVTVKGFDPEYAVSGDFLAAASEGSRNNLAKLLSVVRKYADIDDDYSDADGKNDILFELLNVIKICELTDKIKEIDISNIYGITMNYDNNLKLELGDTSDAELKLVIAKKLIERGEFDSESGTLILTQIYDSSENMKVTFRPDYEASSDESSSHTEPVIGDTTSVSE